VSTDLEVRVERQRSAVADEVSALTAVVRPILEATLYAVKGEIIEQAGGHEKITLAMLARVYKPGDGDCGLCFEWAVHDAMNRHDPIVEERRCPQALLQGPWGDASFDPVRRREERRRPTDRHRPRAAH
jgi:hypothetical protein